MLDDSFCCLRSLIGAKIRFCGLVHTNVYAVYACGCSLSVTCQVAMVNTRQIYLSARLKSSSDYTGTFKFKLCMYWQSVRPITQRCQTHNVESMHRLTICLFFHAYV